MKNDIWIGKKGFRYWYYTYRDSKYYSYSILSVIAIACFILVFYVIIPELSNWFSIRDEIAATQLRIATLKQNISFMNNLDKNTMNKELQTASDALPPEKDIGQMLQSISLAAAESNVSLNDYSFQVGELTASTNSPSPVHTVGTTQSNGVSKILITIVVNGNTTKIKNFIKDLENNLPLANIYDINGSGANVSVAIQFYEKPFPKITFTGDTQLTPIAKDRVSLLESLSKLDTTMQNQNNSTVISSSSALKVPLF